MRIGLGARSFGGRSLGGRSFGGQEFSGREGHKVPNTNPALHPTLPGAKVWDIGGKIQGSQL